MSKRETPWIVSSKESGVNLLALSDEQLRAVVDALQYSGTMCISRYDADLADQIQQEMKK